ncbi:hypothetical protein [Candidatus Propionivibrio aalborgensis]|uniref:hypothetical protein n=1 Tax=Candidatus Propionivibrio aalborgensis TaxID=1860101 RepID=UPI0016445C7B
MRIAAQIVQHRLGAAQRLLGHTNVATTMIYTHVLKVGGGGVRSPVDSLPEVARL